MQQIKNIIFDLGGVILNIDFKHTASAFAKLGIKDFNEYYTLQTISPLFEQLEVGAITPDEFYNKFRELSKNEAITNEQITTAWNALLLDFPTERIHWLKEISKRYKVFLLSNTNQIHYDAFTKAYKENIADENFNDIFIKAYYSHEMGLRKPSKEIFETVLESESLNAAETLFIDDSLPNIEAAKDVGLQVIHLALPKTILELDL